MTDKQRAFLDRFASWLHFQDELNNLGNGLLLMLSVGAAYAVLYLSRIQGGTWQDWVAVAFTLAMILGCDLFFFVVVARSRAAFLSSGQKLPAFLWAFLGCYLAAVNFESLYAYQLVTADGLTEAQAFEHMGITSDNFFLQRAGLIVLLLLVAAIIRHQRATELEEDTGAGSFARTNGGAKRAAYSGVNGNPSPNGGNRRRGVPAAVEVERMEEAKEAAILYLDKRHDASARDIWGYLTGIALPVALSKAQEWRTQYRHDHPELYPTKKRAAAKSRKVA